jgi:glycosyltransferase involved in cell wall biosynthesis
MRTLVIVRTLKTGGMERVAVNLADAFADQGHESHLLYYKKRKDPLYPDNKGVLVHEFNVNKLSLKRPLSILSEVAAKISNLFWRKSYFLIAGWYGGQRLQKKMNQLEKQYGTFDRIIFRGEGTYENIWSFQHDKAIYVLENIVKPNSPSQKLSKKRFHALFHNRQLAAVSTGVKIAADDLFAKENIHPTYVHVITNPCPIEQIRSKANAEKPQTLPSGSYMLNVARLVPQKGQDMLLEAYAKSKQSLPLVIVGEGKLNAELKAKAKALGIDENVHFVGNQENPYVWMKHAELFVLSSKFEGLGIVLFEALACGTPILSVDCPGGVRDIFKGELEPYLCEHNADALAQKMDLVIEQGGYAVKEEWIEDFKPENVVNAFLQK